MTEDSNGLAPPLSAAAIKAGGYGLFDREDDWAACAWFYLDRPQNGLPALAPFTERAAGME